MTKQRQTRTVHGHGLDRTFPRLLGGRLCLDFTNTVEARSTRPEEFLRSYADLVRWGRHAGLLSPEVVAALLAEGERRPVDAAETLAWALILREAIYRVFAAVTNRAAPEEPDLTILRQAYLVALERAQLAAVGPGFAWQWGVDERRLDQMLWPVARSAVALLTTGELARVKACSGPDGCDWLFYDTSKNASRRWCSMEGCGSRAKMRRYTARRRAAQRPPAG